MKVNSPFSASLLILDLSRISVNEIWYDGHSTQIYCMNTDSFINYIKPEYLNIDIAKDVEMRSVTSNHEVARPNQFRHTTGL